MSAEIDDGLHDDVDRIQAAEALARLLADKRFKAADRRKAILSYLVERRFSDDEVKAYVIAVDVLGRPSNFDAATDPIVRIEVSRLRSSLETFYAAYGEDHDIWISVTTGKYVACFRRRSSFPVSESPDDGLHEQSGAVRIIPRSHRVRSWRAALAGALAITAMVGTFATYPYTGRVTVSEKPTVYVSVEAADPRQAGEASQMRDALMTALSRFQTVAVAQPGYASIRSRGADRRYSLQMKYYGDVGDRSVWWQVMDNSSGKMLVSGLEQVETTGKTSASVRDEVVEALAKRIASNRGVINSIELQTDSASLGNACVVRAEYALDSRRDMEAARDCLQRTVLAAPDDSDAKAVLARVLLAPDGRMTPAVTADHALDLAKQAVGAAPLSERAQLALMAAHAARGNVQAAINAGNRALALNPSSSDAAAGLASVLYFAGYSSAGLSMAMDASKNVDVVPRCALIVLALDAFSKERYAQSLVWTEQVNGSSHLTRVLRSAALGELGSGKARASLNGGDVSPPAFKWLVDSVGIRPEMVSMLEKGLSKAGADMETVGSISPQQTGNSIQLTRDGHW